MSAAGLHRQRAVTLCSGIAGAGGSPSFAEKLQKEGPAIPFPSQARRKATAVIHGALRHRRP